MSELAPSEVHKTRSKVRGDDCEACFYCGLPMGNFHHEHDHMPRPASAGGESVVAACITCHDMKDRYRAANWNATWWVNAVFELMASDALATALRQPDVLPDAWPSMSRSGRLLWASLARLSHQDPDGPRRQAVQAALTELAAA